MKRVKKILLTILTALTLTINFKNEVKAYEYPDEYYYIEVIDKNLSQITIYIPKNSVQAFSLKEDRQIINITGSTITGYVNGLDYTISFQPYQYGRYRAGSSYDYTYLDIQEIVDTNIRFSNESDILINTYGDYLMTTMMIIIGGFVILLWLKH